MVLLPELWMETVVVYGVKEVLLIQQSYLDHGGKLNLSKPSQSMRLLFTIDQIVVESDSQITW